MPRKLLDNEYNCGRLIAEQKLFNSIIHADTKSSSEQPVSFSDSGSVLSLFSPADFYCLLTQTNKITARFACNVKRAVLFFLHLPKCCISFLSDTASGHISVHYFTRGFFSPPLGLMPFSSMILYAVSNERFLTEFHSSISVTNKNCIV